MPGLFREINGEEEGLWNKQAGNQVNLNAFQTGSDPYERQRKLLGIQKMRQAAGGSNGRGAWNLPGHNGLFCGRTEQRIKRGQDLLGHSWTIL